MNEIINLSFRYAKSDIVRAIRSHNASRMRHRLDIFLLILLAAFVIIPPVTFRVNPKYRDDYSLVFSAEGIHFRTVHIDSQLQWSVYSRALVDAYSYILYYGSRTFTVIPKRVFQDSEQQSALERMLGQHVPKVITRA
jgi:hypothetical protein